MTAMDGARVVATARTWIGTPYRHQASVRAAGTDCLGLLRGIWRDLNGTEPELPPAYSRDWSEPQGEEVLWRAARRHLLNRPLEVEAPGDILLFRMCAGCVAKHLGVAADIGGGASFIHAYSGHAVVESPLSLPWRRRIVARFALPEGDF
nr:peptidase [Thalassovita sp.]